MKIPCPPDCPTRSETCHSECFDYALYSAVNEVKRENRYKEKQKMAGVYEYQAKRHKLKLKRIQNKLIR